MLTPSDWPADHDHKDYVDSASHCDDVWIRNGVVAWIEIFRVSLIDSVQRGYLFYSLSLCPRAKVAAPAFKQFDVKPWAFSG